MRKSQDVPAYGCIAARVVVSTFKRCSNTLCEHTLKTLFKRLNTNVYHCSNTRQLEGCRGVQTLFKHCLNMVVLVVLVLVCDGLA